MARIKEIVVSLNDTAAAAKRLRLALRIADTHESHVVGLYIVDIPQQSSYVAAEMPATFFSMLREHAAKRTAAAREIFDQLTADRTTTTEWRMDSGSTVDQLCINARRSDLLVAGLDTSTADLEDAPQADTLAQTLLSLGVGTLLVPKDSGAIDIGRFITIGWNGSRDAARAVHDALPLLVAAEKVSISCVDPRSRFGAEHGDEPGADVAHWLARHDVNAEAQTVPRGNKSTGDTLLEWAKAQGSDLLVVGGYGHSRVREMLLGGVTAHILNHARIPVLMSH